MIASMNGWEWNAETFSVEYLLAWRDSGSIICKLFTINIDDTGKIIYTIKCFYFPSQHQLCYIKTELIISSTHVFNPACFSLGLVMSFGVCYTLSIINVLCRKNFKRSGKVGGMFKMLNIYSLSSVCFLFSPIAEVI